MLLEVYKAKQTVVKKNQMYCYEKTCTDTNSTLFSFSFCLMFLLELSYPYLLLFIYSIIFLRTFTVQKIICGNETVNVNADSFEGTALIMHGRINTFFVILGMNIVPLFKS